MKNISPIKNKLKIYRKQSNLTQKQVANILNLKCSSIISRWENGTKLPNLIQALQLAALYRRLVTDIFYDLFCEQREKVIKNEKKNNNDFNVTIY
jgi:DNA-binding XRE family transcriptional regulator